MADVFAFQNDRTVAAITSDGVTAWTADVSQTSKALPDFQGGLVTVKTDEYGRSISIVKLDGITGDKYNVSIINAGKLSNANLALGATVTFNACSAGYGPYGGRHSIAQNIANELKRTVLAYPVDMYFSAGPTPKRFQPGMTSPTSCKA